MSFAGVAARAFLLFLAAGDACSQGSGRCPLADLQRAKEKVPRAPWKGRTFGEMASVLNEALRSGGSAVKDCMEWSAEELVQLQRRLFAEAEPALLEVYQATNDGRSRRFTSLADLEQHWARLNASVAVSGQPELLRVRRDGLCHETVMWWVHHLPSAAQSRLRAAGLVVPSLPTQRHGRGSAPHVAEAGVHDEYEQQVSCQQCHTGKIEDPEWQDATLPAPLPVDKEHPGRERLAHCDFQNQPPCGPCEGLGGIRTGDDPEEMTPMRCEAVHGPEVPPATQGRYPYLGFARFTGDTRSPVEVRPSRPGHYFKVNATLALGWKGGVMRMRYDFNGLGTQVSAQSLEQARRQDVGATIGMGPGSCECSASIAGNMHVMSFEASDPLDSVRLPAEKGGAAYLGKVRVQLDGESELGQRMAVADHFMKWAFHFLVDADPSSETFGLPLRLYGPGGVRMIYESWRLGDPEEVMPGLWKLPAKCNVTSPSCEVFEREAPAASAAEELFV